MMAKTRVTLLAAILATFGASAALANACPGICPHGKEELPLDCINLIELAEIDVPGLAARSEALRHFDLNMNDYVCGRFIVVMCPIIGPCHPQYILRGPFEDDLED